MEGVKVGKRAGGHGLEVGRRGENDRTQRELRSPPFCRKKISILDEDTGEDRGAGEDGRLWCISEA